MDLSSRYNKNMNILNTISEIRTGYNPRSTTKIEQQIVFIVYAKDLATNFTEVSELAIPRSYNSYLQDGDILVKSRGANYEAKVFRPHYQGHPYVAASTLLVIRLTSNAYKPAYIARIINSKRTQQLLRLSSSGSIVLTLSPSSIGAIPCPETSPEKQEQLENFTNVLEDYRTCLTKYQRAGEDLTKAIEQQLTKGVL